MAVSYIALVFFSWQVGSVKAVDADCVIRNVMIYDGTGVQGYLGDLAIKDDRIVALGPVKCTGKPKEIDGAGLVAAPGFIDLHTHSDSTLLSKATRANLCYLHQGVTTVVTGNCGSGPVDVDDYFAKLEKSGIGSNVIHQIPQGAVRSKVMGNANRPPSEKELAQMEDLVDRNMKAGAWGISTGLIYTPSTFAQTEELIALAKVVARHNGHYATHIRGEGVGVLIALEEALTIGRKAKLPVHISHLKASGRRAWGKAAEEILLLEKARKEGVKVTADQYPYIASSTSLTATLIPLRFREGTQKEYLSRLADPDPGSKIRRAILDEIDFTQAGKAIRIASFKPKPEWQGKTLGSIAELEKKSLLDIVLSIERQGGAKIVNFSMNEEDMRLIMKQPFVATASDGSSQDPTSDAIPHPRSYGCFARKIGRLAFEEKLLSPEQAIRSATGLPADILKLPERGYLKAGYFADIVVLDPKTYRDQATFEKPNQYAVGVRYLFVNGKMVIDKGKYQDVLAGKVLRHKSPSSE
jgi:N-acyl-D-aspartate/D-glutamate deacylase